jgi:hypothetical protein
VAVYIVIGLVVLALLVLSYRALGGSAVGAVDSPALLRSTAQDIAALGAHEPDGARELRRSLAGCAQQLERIETGALDEPGAEAHDLLTAAVQELTWAQRLRESGAHQTAGGMQRAVDELQAHARTCIDHAGLLLRTSGGSEEVGGPA